MSRERNLKIGMTDDHRTPSRVEEYRRWLTNVDAAIDFSLLSPGAAGVDELDALVLTGGGDLHPKFYGRGDALDRAEGVLLERDVYEMKTVERALELDLPILAICRGMQVLNVTLGGSLLVDVASAGFQDHRGPGMHKLQVDPHALLFFAAGVREAEVNTSHHQAVDRLGNGLRPSGFATDGVIEAVEWSSKEGMPFLLGVQWHPERIPDHGFSRNIATLFLRAAQRFHSANSTTSHQ
ncbi:MAG: gamma-glutamyl-gamma-aminobutyrate hydrolase family protein [Bacteroidota bacterium]